MRPPPRGRVLPFGNAAGSGKMAAMPRARLPRRSSPTTAAAAALTVLLALLALTAAAPARAGAPITTRPACAHSYLYFLPGASRSDYRDAVLCLINGARKAQHLPALKRSAPLEQAGQAQSDRFATTGSAGHGKTLTEITRRFARKGYRAAAYDEGFSVLDGGASPYAFLAEMTRRWGVGAG
jgi:uncharacterized protein YkwD